ncbi:TlyA family RNA methyltransferase [Candidatus Saccharibacteria bacterium]|nr:TlyA family RNA methyltransferase [Candidatus Saccharibacteria bacterium]
MKQRLDQYLAASGLVSTRSQAESYIRLGKVRVNGKIVIKAGELVAETAAVELTSKEQYVSRAGLKLASVAELLKLDFKSKIVLDVGSSTGGFTDYALQHGAEKVIAVDVGTNQLHPTFQGHPKIELHEQTDIRGFQPSEVSDIIIIDVSFISLKEILPHISKISDEHTQIVAMLKPQFEAGDSTKHKGVIKNDKIRRQILQDFEMWSRKYFVIKNKADSEVAGAKGNQERFYLLKKL